MANQSAVLDGTKQDLGTLLSLVADASYLLQNKSKQAIVYVGDFSDATAANEADAFEILPGHFLLIPNLPSAGGLFGWCVGASANIAINEAS